MKRRVVIFIACWFFAGGIVIASFLPKNLMFFGLYYFSVAALLLVLAAWFWKKKNIRAIILWAAFLFFSAWRFSAGLPVDSPDKVWHYNGQKIEFIGLVSAQPSSKGKSQKLEIQSLAINNSPLERGGPPLAGRGVLFH